MSREGGGLGFRSRVDPGGHAARPTYRKTVVPRLGDEPGIGYRMGRHSRRHGRRRGRRG